jgi:hypothetical protein
MIADRGESNPNGPAHGGLSSVAATAGLGLPRTTVYAAGLLLTAIVSLALAELWIRTRAMPRIRGAS